MKPTVYLTEEHLGPDATAADVQAIKELLADDYNVVYGIGHATLTEEEFEAFSATLQEAITALGAREAE